MSKRESPAAIAAFLKKHPPTYRSIAKFFGDLVIETTDPIPRAWYKKAIEFLNERANAR